ncbi:transposase [Streptomyces griseoaurantiacus]|uniref:transposase n=1 Tax=Streptomyces griseoaurantiacus TaxID=68213 RepID=UPI0037B8904F
MGRPVRDRRQVVTGIRSCGSCPRAPPGETCPRGTGPEKTVYERFRRWSAEPGTGSLPMSSSIAASSARLTGRSCAWTQRPCVPTSTWPA